jgi:hypothetical protein
MGKLSRGESGPSTGSTHFRFSTSSTGGYSKTYITKSKAKGVALDDTFFLKLDPTNPDWLKKLKWEKRKRVGQVPNLRSGSTMVNWVNKSMAVGFGGVLDLEDNEEGLVSEFYNDLSVLLSCCLRVSTCRPSIR